MHTMPSTAQCLLPSACSLLCSPAALKPLPKLSLSQLLNYATTHPDVVLHYITSNMTLYIHSDASYLSKPKAQSQVGSHFYLSSKPLNPTKRPPTQPPNNGAIHTVSNILKNVMSSATESEFAGLFHNTKYAKMIRTILSEMGYPQLPTPIQTDNYWATGIANGTTGQRKSKGMDTWFYWIQDLTKQGHFLIYWRKGSENLGDYFTKHHHTAHHCLM
jgi:hypothetical protein